MQVLADTGFDYARVQHQPQRARRKDPVHQLSLGLWKLHLSLSFLFHLTLLNAEPWPPVLSALGTQTSHGFPLIDQHYL